MKFWKILALRSAFPTLATINQRIFPDPIFLVALIDTLWKIKCRFSRIKLEF